MTLSAIARHRRAIAIKAELHARAGIRGAYEAVKALGLVPKYQYHAEIDPDCRGLIAYHERHGIDGRGKKLGGFVRQRDGCNVSQMLGDGNVEAARKWANKSLSLFETPEAQALLEEIKRTRDVVNSTPGSRRERPRVDAELYITFHAPKTIFRAADGSYNAE